MPTYMFFCLEAKGLVRLGVSHVCFDDEHAMRLAVVMGNGLHQVDVFTTSHIGRADAASVQAVN